MSTIGFVGGRTPTISVVLTTYRRPALLERALRSVLTQTVPPDEILVCDNGADPQTAEVVARVGRGRVHHLARTSDLGILGNAIDGLSRARGDLLFKLDDDDILEPWCLETLRAPFLADPTLTATFSDFLAVDLSGRELPQETERRSRLQGRSSLSEGRLESFSDLAAQGGVQLVSALFRQGIVDWDEVPQDVATSYDLYIALECARAGAAYFVERPSVRYAVHPEQDSTQLPLRSARGAAAALHVALTRAPGAHDRRALRVQLAKIHVMLSREARLADDLTGAVTAAVRSLQLAPTGAAVRQLIATSASAGTRVLRTFRTKRPLTLHRRRGQRRLPGGFRRVDESEPARG